jgi:hypothetical protein
MRTFTIFVVMLSSLSLFSADKKPVFSSTPLTADQIEIYRVFLANYNNGSKSTLNLSENTTSFDFERYGGKESCIASLKLDSNSGQQVHRFDAQFHDFADIRLVNPNEQSQKIKEGDPEMGMRQGKSVEEAVKAGFAAGLLTLSEIVFDSTGRFAAMSFSFRCGALCGHGGVIIFEKTNEGKWLKANRPCSSWIS